MITLYNTKSQFKKTVSENELQKSELQKSWIHLTSPTSNEIEKIHELTNINKNLLIKSLDEEETAHIEIEEETTLIVVDTIYNESTDVSYNTIPFSILINEEYIVTISMKEDIFIDDLFNKKNSKLHTNKKISLILKLLYFNARHYIHILKKIERSTQEIENQLNQAMKNEGLLETLHLSKTLVYISTSISSNLVVISKLEKLDKFKEFSDDVDLLEDTVIETMQAKETCTIYREILTTKMDAYASIINNNVNSVMKLLAIVTIIVTIPTLMASIFGMNVKLPFQNSEYGFIIVITTSLVLSILGTIVLLKFSNKKSKKKV